MTIMQDQKNLRVSVIWPISDFCDWQPQSNVEDDTSETKNKPLDDKAEGATKSSSEIDGDRENDWNKWFSCNW